MNSDEIFPDKNIDYLEYLEKKLLRWLANIKKHSIK